MPALRQFSVARLEDLLEAREWSFEKLVKEVYRQTDGAVHISINSLPNWRLSRAGSMSRQFVCTGLIQSNPASIKSGISS